MSVFSKQLQRQRIAYADGATPVATTPKPTAPEWMNGIANILTGVGSVFTGWGNAKKPGTSDPNDPLVIPPAPKNNTALWIGILVAAITLGVVLWWVVKKKK